MVLLYEGLVSMEFKSICENVYLFKPKWEAIVVLSE